MVEYIESNPKITLQQLKEKFQHLHQITVSKECLRKHLDGLLYTLKIIRHEPERANSDENKMLRRDFARQLLNYQADNVPLLFMDETNFNLYISRSQGRSKKGTRCRHITAGSRGANIHVIGCISNMGLIHYEVKRGSFKKPDAKEFVRNCLTNASNVYQTPVVLIIDNAPCHAGVEEVFQEENFSNNYLLRLSPYSPMLNAIEHAWSTLKAGVKRDLANQIHQILNNENRANITQSEYRLQRLENIIQNNINQINVPNCVRYIAHIQRHIPDAIELNDMMF